MINVNQITSQLAKMPDQALQKYAALNKNDPYILALAVAESNRRKELRQAAQAPQGMQPQPKVADQAVAGMTAPMPEAVGIGQLPAGNMEFADGGIVAFADGGEVERYQTGGSLAGDLTYADTMGFGVAPEALAMDEYRRAELRRKRQAEEDAARLQFLETAAPETAARLKTEARGPASASAVIPYDPSTATRRSMYKTAPYADTTSRVPPATSAAPSVAAPVFDPSRMFADTLAGVSKEERPERGMIEGINKANVDAAQAELGGLRKLQEQFGDAYKGRRERLSSREAELGKAKDQTLGLALLQAGAAMMSTPGSFGTVVGRGIEAGSRQYVAGIDKLNAAKEKLADARDRLDDLELNRNEMSAREILKAETGVRRAAIAGQENMVKYIMERDKVDRETAMKIVDNQIRIGLTQMEIQGRKDVAAATANRNPTLELLQAVQRDPSLAQAYQALHGTKNDLMAQYTDYLGKNPTGTIEDFLKTKAAFSTLSGMLSRPVANPPPGSIAPRAP